MINFLFLFAIGSNETLSPKVTIHCHPSFAMIESGYITTLLSSQPTKTHFNIGSICEMAVIPTEEGLQSNEQFRQDAELFLQQTIRSLVSTGNENTRNLLLLNTHAQGKPSSKDFFYRIIGAPEFQNVQFVIEDNPEFWDK